jgi:hypothetical protein
MWSRVRVSMAWIYVKSIIADRECVQMYVASVAKLTRRLDIAVPLVQGLVPSPIRSRRAGTCVFSGSF